MLVACLSVNDCWGGVSPLCTDDHKPTFPTLADCTPIMSLAKGTMFDQVIDYYFQNLSADSQVRDEENILSYAQELRIEVYCFSKFHS